MEFSVFSSVLKANFIVKGKILRFQLIKNVVYTQLILINLKSGILIIRFDFVIFMKIEEQHIMKRFPIILL